VGTGRYRHFRHATRTWHLEIPRGFGVANDSSEESVRRELAEELGATISRLVSLGQVYPATDFSSANVEFFYAEVESYSKVETDEAIVDLFSTPIVEFELMIQENKINDAFTLTAYALAKARCLL
jgi:ADP-ribose pyrophosphatase